MAGFLHQRSGSRVSANGGIGEQLPSGSCDFRDLSIGARAPKCGCKRFWLNNNHYNSIDGNAERAYCFCGHHACFHNASSQSTAHGRASIGAVRASLLEDATAGSGSGSASGQQRQDVQRGFHSSQPAGLGIRPGSSAQSASINTRVWEALNAFARNQEDGTVSDSTSKLPSTATPSIVGDAATGQNRVQFHRPMGPPVNIPVPYLTVAGGEEYSATEVATPSVAGTPDFRAFTIPGAREHASPAEAATSGRDIRTVSESPVRPMTAPPQQPAAATRPSQPEPQVPAQPDVSARDMQAILQAYGRRIDVLETLSFSQVPIEEVQEKFELFDGRLLDLEHWRADLDHGQASPEPVKPESSKRRRLLPTEESSSGSDGSFDSAAAAHTEAVVLATLAANAETGPRIDELENRVADLEYAASPSFARPWQVEVVLLPWGRELRGIWFSLLEAAQHSLRSSTQVSDEWTGAQSAPKLSFKSSESAAWTTESIRAWANEAQEWLSPKACGPTGTVFERLASRGLVRHITISASDSRHILDAIDDAFGDVLPAADEEPCPETQRFQGLRERIIPLRKVRRSTRLRFLSQSEMVTSAAWSSAFLDSCAMKVKSGQRRLYMTTPEAYLQSRCAGLSWPGLRRLPMHDATGEEQAAQATNAAIEACWTYNDRLDRPTSTHSSFVSHASHRSERSQHAIESQAEQPNEQPLSPRSEDRPAHHRTVSLPSSSSVAEQVKDILPKRRVASFETPAMVLMQGGGIDTSIAAKRRRISVSPEAERRGVGFTPRWSREPPSPFTSEHAGETRSQGGVSRKRGTTPFAYATPHSNNTNNMGFMTFVGGDGDTEADSEVPALQNERMEDEWQGVEEGDNMETGFGESAYDEHEIDEDNLAEGLTIYEA